MRTSNPGLPAELSRNPVPAYSTVLCDDYGPHGYTTQLSITVPTGKIFRITKTSAQILRLTAATTLDQSGIMFYSTAQIFGHVRQMNNTIGATVYWVTPETIYVLEGQTIEAITCDDSTGGTQCYEISVSYVSLSKC